MLFRSSSPLVDVPGVGPLTGENMMEKIKTPEAKPLAQMLGLGGMEALAKTSPATATHYTEFSKGPLEAFNQMLREAPEDAGKQLRGDLLKARYDAMRASTVNGKVDPALFEENYAKQLGYKLHGSANIAKRFDADLKAADPAAYSQHMDAVAQGVEGAHLHDAMVSKLPYASHFEETPAQMLERHKLTAPAGVSPADRIKSMLSNDEDLVTQGHALRASRGFMRGPGLYEPVKTWTGRAAKLQRRLGGHLKNVRFGAGAAGLAGLGLAGLGGYAMTRNKKEQE